MSTKNEQQPTPLQIRQQIIRLHPADNVVIARVDILAGTSLDEGLVSLHPTKAGHKIASHVISSGEPLCKDGRIIGRAAVDLAAGAAIGNGDFQFDGQIHDPLPSAVSGGCDKQATFQGYPRGNGRAGTRNYLGVLIVGNCAATAARNVADWFTPERLAAYPNVDGVIPFIHEIGCGMEMTGEPMDLLRRTLSGCVRNANMAGAVVMALGCERNNIYGFLEQEKLAVSTNFQTVVLQEVGGTAQAISEGIAAIQNMLPVANRVARQTVSAACLSVGLQTTAVDGFCALSANPALGHAMDLLVACGGTVILSDTADLAALGDDVLTRAATPQVADSLRQVLTESAQYQAGRDTALNRRILSEREAKGLSTIRERALTGLSRAGTSPIQAVYGYGHVIEHKGLVFMDAPNYEAVSATGQVASGATFICLTTGSGSGFGAAMAPTLKLASTSAVYRHMQDDLDIDCGPVLDAQLSREQMGELIFARLLAHASGELTCSEQLGVGENEFVPWPKGVLA